MEIYHTIYLLSQPLKCILALVNVIVIYDRFCDRFFWVYHYHKKYHSILEFKLSIYHKKYHYHDIGIGPRSHSTSGDVANWEPSIVRREEILKIKKTAYNPDADKLSFWWELNFKMHKNDKK